MKFTLKDFRPNERLKKALLAFGSRGFTSIRIQQSNSGAIALSIHRHHKGKIETLLLNANGVPISGVSKPIKYPTLKAVA
jgi:hypothetical protein